MTGLPTGTGKGPQSPERALLSELDRWRSAIARNAALRNPVLRSWELNAFVHGIMNQCLYLRICGDRGLIPSGTLRDIAPSTGIRERISSLFLDAEKTSPLALFACTREEDQAASARETVLDDRVLRGFLEALSSPAVPWDFRVFPVVKLAGVYRAFFRKEIRLMGGHRAVLEETAAAKGAGGYPPPPEAARDYLVARTLEGTAGERSADDAALIRVLDPACGPGHLLLLSCHHLLSRYRNSLTDGKVAPRGQGPVERLRILGSLFGVDPDPRAVEVARMLLLLGALEGREGDHGLAPGTDPVLLGRVLREQIRCGNAVIGPGYGEETFPRPSPRRVREQGIPMDWAAAFPAVTGSGGFDVVVMEPPTHHPGTEPGLRRYLQQHFQAYHDDADMAVYLMERGISLIRCGGTFASLTPDRWLRARYGGPLRKILSTLQMEEIVLVTAGTGGTAEGTGHCILRLSPCPASHGLRVLRVAPGALDSMVASRMPRGTVVDPASLGTGGWTFTARDFRELKERVNRISSPLCRYVVGTLTCGDPAIRNDRSLVDRGTRDRLIREDRRNPAEFRPVVVAEQVRRYAPVAPELYLAGKGLPGIPVETGAGRESSAQAPGGILCAEHGGAPVCTLDTSGALAGGRVAVIPRPDLYLLGILNSTFSRFLFREGGGGLSVRWLEQFPVYIPDFSALDDTARHDRLVTLVSRMLELHARTLRTGSDEGKGGLQRRIETTDREIDELVYELYGVTGEERRVVEEQAG